MTINIIENEKQPITLQDIYDTWYQIKRKYWDAIVVLRNSDKYYSFEEDAKLIMGVMGIESIPQWKERELCIFPYHAIELCLHKVVKLKYRIVVAEPRFPPLTQ